MLAVLHALAWLVQHAVPWSVRARTLAVHPLFPLLLCFLFLAVEDDAKLAECCSRRVPLLLPQQVATLLHLLRAYLLVLFARAHH